MAKHVYTSIAQARIMVCKINCMLPKRVGARPVRRSARQATPDIGEQACLPRRYPTPTPGGLEGLPSASARRVGQRFEAGATALTWSAGRSSRPPVFPPHAARRKRTIFDHDSSHGYESSRKEGTTNATHYSAVHRIEQHIKYRRAVVPRSASWCDGTA